MACKNVEEYAIIYGRLADEIKDICTNKVCTLDTIQKTLADKGIEVSEGVLLMIIDQIEGMMILDKAETYDVGDAIVYRKGKMLKSDEVGNLMVRIIYKKFYLYNVERYKDQAFKEHIRSKLEFEIDKQKRKTITCSSDMRHALEGFNIPKEYWKDYVFVEGDSVNVYYMDYEGNSTFKKYIGKFIKNYPIKENPIKETDGITS